MADAGGLAWEAAGSTRGLQNDNGRHGRLAVAGAGRRWQGDEADGVDMWGPYVRPPPRPAPSAVEIGRPRTRTLYEVAAARHADLLRELASSGSPSPGRRSPPTAPPSPGSTVPGSNGNAEVSFPEPDYVERAVSDSEETVESDNSGIDWDNRSPSIEAWVSPGDPSLSSCLLFAHVDRPEEVGDMREFLQAAFGSVQPMMPVEMLPSSRGVMIFRFTSHEEREMARECSPIPWERVVLSLERPEDSDNRFFFVPEWLALVALKEFPLDHWTEEKIKACFTAGCRVVEINPEFLSGNNFAPLQLVLEVKHYLDVPYEVSLSECSGIGREGMVVEVLPISVWPRENQIGPDGNLLPYFNQPPPPPPEAEADAEPEEQPPATGDSMQQQGAGNTPNPTQLQPPNNAAGLQMLALAAPFAHLARQQLFSTLPAAPTNECFIPLPRSPSLAHYHSSPTAVAKDNPAPAAPPPPKAPRRRRTKPIHAADAPQRKSSRLAGKAPPQYVHATVKATNRRALLDSLLPCSGALKSAVKKQGLLVHSRVPLAIPGLRKLARAAGLGCKAASSIGVVPPVAK
ncbi:hypothetical protein BS78_K342600 [Paspalum vaginatum]|uniref:DUF4283 domain-containing protein n=1 Tax=Paspalum vaginatum TaxID=158149 RepID=A0A9W8CFV4_9POAL|nr:hypothetical protein BS78_K342600 [Paspalum vaginatum]